ncbi:MAG: HEAT repeat domain-containing protein [Promethearchaeota archaeon]
MATATITDLATRRQYSELEKRADKFIEREGWANLLRMLKYARPEGKARDAVISLLQLEAIGGTDNDLFEELGSLDGDSLHEIRANAVEPVMDLLKEQIENNHTYFIDIDAMTMTPYVILVKEVIEARKRELEQLEGTPSRLDVLGTFYGFQILITDGSKPFDRQNSSQSNRWYSWRRSTWLDEKITESAARAMKSITAELAEEVDMDKRYRTLGGNRIFRRRCTRPTADILANAVRLTLYKAPGHRGSAARALGRTGDSRALSFLHHRFPLEQNKKTRIAIAEAIGRIGQESSIEILKERVTPRGRYLSKEGRAMISSLGGISHPQSKEALIELLKHDSNTTRAAVIQALGKQEETGLVDLLKPHIVSKSRPVVRASIFALTDLGKEGESIVRENAHVAIKRIGYDKPSKNALIRMLSVSGVSKMPSVHQYFAKRIEKLGKQINQMQRSSSSS